MAKKSKASKGVWLGGDEAHPSDKSTLAVEQTILVRGREVTQTEDRYRLSDKVPPQKKPRAASPKAKDDAADLRDAIAAKTASAKAARQQGASIDMAQWEAQKETIEQRILGRYGSALVRQPCACDTMGPRLFKCETCFNAEPVCRECALKAHVHEPFHWMGEWEDGYFARKDLASLGITIPLQRNHDCPVPRSRALIIGHTNGIHQCKVEFCDCSRRAPECEQLCSSGLFPATVKEPRTAFTFEVMEQFRLLCIKSKTTAYQFYHVLEYLTDPSGMSDTPSRSRQFTRATRVWQFLALRRDSGQCSGIDRFMWPAAPNADAPQQAPKPGSLVTPCPACPKIGFNITKEAYEAVPLDKRHTVTVYLSADGNFKLQLKFKGSKTDSKDFSLHHGNGVFPENCAYRTFLDETGNSPAIKGKQEKSSDDCPRIKAADLRNVARFANAEVNGVLAVQCGRHAFFIVMVDLYHGERWVCADYALAQVLAQYIEYRWIFLGYDVACSYLRYLKDRTRILFPSLFQAVLKVEGAINKLHIHNHEEACQFLYSFNWKDFCGRTHGESIESSWSVVNHAAAATKDENAGHRHEHLDQVAEMWNWDKLVRMDAWLCRKYIEAKQMYYAKKIIFDAFKATLRPELVAEWEATDRTVKGTKKNYECVYRNKWASKPPSLTKASAALRKAEREEELEGADASDAVETLMLGIQIESWQRKLGRIKKDELKPDNKEEAILKLRVDIMRDMKKLRGLQMIICPQLAVSIAALTTRDPAEQKVLLPSYFDKENCEKLGIMSLRELEYRLREGQLHDALRDVRESVKFFDASVEIRKKDVRGYGAVTRTQQRLRDLFGDKTTAMDEYNAIRARLVELGLDAKDNVLRPMTKNDLWIKTVAEPSEIGAGKKMDPWIWCAGMPADVSQNEWSAEMDRVKFFRDFQELRNWEHEVEILEAEFQRTIQSFSKLGASWRDLGTSAAANQRPGEAAWAFQRSAMFGRLMQRAQVKYAAAMSAPNEKLSPARSAGTSGNAGQS